MTKQDAKDAIIGAWSDYCATIGASEEDVNKWIEQCMDAVNDIECICDCSKQSETRMTYHDVAISLDLPIQVAGLLNNIIMHNTDSVTTTRQAIDRACAILGFDQGFGDVLEACMLYTRKGDPTLGVRSIDVLAWVSDTMTEYCLHEA